MSTHRILWLVLPVALMSACGGKQDERAGVLKAINAALHKKGKWCISFDQFGEVGRLQTVELQGVLDGLTQAKLVQVKAATIQQASVLGGTIPAPGYLVTLTSLGKTAYNEAQKGFCLGEKRAVEVSELDFQTIEGHQVGMATYSYTLPTMPSWAKALTTLPEVEAISNGQPLIATASIEENDKGFEAVLIGGK